MEGRLVRLCLQGMLDARLACQALSGGGWASRTLLPGLVFLGVWGGALVLLTVGVGLGRGRSTPCVFHRRFSAP